VFFVLIKFNPFQLCLKKFLQPGRQGILNPCRATKQTVLLKKFVQEGHKVGVKTKAKCVLTPQCKKTFSS
jgi:hypothetical protein